MLSSDYNSLKSVTRERKAGGLLGRKERAVRPWPPSHARPQFGALEGPDAPPCPVCPSSVKEEIIQRSMAACLCPVINSSWPAEKFFQILLPFVKLAKVPGGSFCVTEGGGKGGLSPPGFTTFSVDLVRHMVKAH